jgi:ribose/xylose/arabinose/galactoside ABC-type transport system permease subunit
MRAVDLVKIAAEAEILRIRHMLKRQGMRAALGFVAIVFALGVLVLANVAGWQVLRLYVPPIYATLIMLGINLLIAVIFGLLAARSSPSRAEREALEIRGRALREARTSLALGALIPVAGALLRSRRGSTRKRPFWRRLK